MSAEPPRIVPVVNKPKARCPLVARSDRFPDAPKGVRCVLDDTHVGLCKLIDGHDLVAVGLRPHERYLVMDLPVPDYLRPAPPPWWAFWKWSLWSR